ncbi:CoB--CoM heterodisulfide reductase subunit B [Methanolobus profundi]|uniref:CoB--CoM heterodisulfide reductase subunit B n=1 Tax=Methanolobus profundi TaxID=487685 RepID=A0A1I4RUZ4_9EURY|nr:CoB--CoM heterodisulfide reductase subunit B [Methanolobus profundi]SFM56011.1 CoB--CoM heterodisulfide reductase subunit B [Methanolobus profundi]
MSNLSLFLGCVAPNRYPGIEAATKKTFSKLGIELDDLEGASCCPAPGVFRSFDKVTWLTLASRNIALSEEMDDDVLTICNGCYSTLKEADHELKSDADLKKDVNEKLFETGHEFRGQHDVRHVIEYLYQEIGVEGIRELVTAPLNMRVAVHYGCHLVQPLKEADSRLVSGDITFFDELVEATGATSVDYEDKMMCCGAGGGARAAAHDATLRITEKKLENMADAQVDCIINACPFCHLQFDSGQKDINEGSCTSYGIPVLHYTQLLGLAMGLSPEELGIDLNVTSTSEFIEKINDGSLMA